MPNRVTKAVPYDTRVISGQTISVKVFWVTEGPDHILMVKALTPGIDATVVPVEERLPAGLSEKFVKVRLTSTIGSSKTKLAFRVATGIWSAYTAELIEVV